jgi:hypothetical protein
MAFTTRPSQLADGRTTAGAEKTSAQQPHRTPSRGANGIRSALSPAKPTTSQGTFRARSVSMTTRAPTGMA